MADNLRKADAYGDLYEYAREFREKKPPERKGRLRFVLLAALVLVLAAGAVLGAFALAKARREREIRAALEISTFYQGITIDGVDVSSMTYAEALLFWQNKEEAARENFCLTLESGTRSLEIDADMAGLAFNTQEVLDDAYFLARDGDIERRYALTQRLSEEGRHYRVHMTYDLLPVRERIVAFCESLGEEPVNARVQGFDYETKQFLIRDATKGRAVNAAGFANAVIARIEAGDIGPGLKVSPDFYDIPAAVNREDLAGALGLRARYATETTRNEDRNTNIRLAAQAVTGVILQPGEVFSFNEATGKRSTDKGYRAAGAIVNGVLVDEPGGGVCQVSSTLFNAVARADLEIVKRSPHSWPSSYVPLGEDAAVDYPSTDFQFRNNTQQTLYISMRYEDRVLTAEIYGLKLEEGVSIDLESEHTGYIKPDSPIIKVNDSLRQGKVLTQREERYGQNATTYILYYRNGELERREEYHKSHYRAIQGIYETGPNTTVPRKSPN